MQKLILHNITFLCFGLMACADLLAKSEAAPEKTCQEITCEKQDSVVADKNDKQQQLELVLANFWQKIVVANDPIAKQEAEGQYKVFCDELFATPETLFKRYCPSALVLCKHVFPTFDKEKVELFVNFIIDQTNLNPASYFNKKLQDFWAFDLEVLLRELNGYLAYFNYRKELKASHTCLRLKALILDFLFFKAYSFLLKDKVDYKDLGAVDVIVRAIKPLIQAMVNTKYEHYYRQRLEMLNLVLTKLGDTCY